MKINLVLKDILQTNMSNTTSIEEKRRILKEAVAREETTLAATKSKIAKAKNREATVKECLLDTQKTIVSLLQAEKMEREALSKTLCELASLPLTMSAPSKSIKHGNEGKFINDHKPIRNEPLA